jgi:hypothetical protein
MHHLPPSVTAGAAIAGAFLLVFSTAGFALETDPASAIRGSLGIPIGDLDLSNQAGLLCFLLNGGMLLLVAGIALFLGGKRTERPVSRPLMASSSKTQPVS